MKNSDYVLRLESPLSGETNSYSSFFIHHSSFNELFTKNRKRNSYSSFFILHSSFNEPRQRDFSLFTLHFSLFTKIKSHCVARVTGQ